MIAMALVGCAACAKSTPTPPPPTVNPGDPVTVTGREHLGWDQGAGSLTELNTVGYYIYIDDNPPQRLNGVACAPGQTTGSFVCQAPLPNMTAGAHTLQATSFYLDTPNAESAKSGPLQLVMQGIVTGGSAMASDLQPRSTPQSASSANDTPWPAGLVRIADGLDRPADLAFTPDSRLWIAERGGRIRVLRGGVIAAEPALTLDPRISGGAVVSLAPDPHFAGNHFLFATYTERSRSGHLTFAIARFRETADTLADRVVILDNVAASDDPRAMLRFGPDGKLYAAFDDGGDARLVQDPASFNGKILRLNPDGTTPDDAPRKSPILSAGPMSPRGLAWHRATDRLWAADLFTVGDVRWAVSPESMLIVKDDLIVGSASGLVRAQIQRTDPPRLTAMHDVLRDVPIRAVTLSPDGSVYVATDTSIGRLQDNATTVARR
jgi:glucose/arabinose dehydrogenase